MAEPHTLHHPSQSDGPQDPGWPAEEEPSPSEGQGELSYKAVVKQEINVGSCTHRSFQFACICLP